VRGYLNPPPRGDYLIALGSNQRHPRHGDPRRVLAAALATLAGTVTVVAAAPTLASPAIGPSRRRYANSAALIETPLAPPALLAELKRIERAFGRRPGQRWGARVLDLDIVLWKGGRWRGGARRAWLQVPHPHYHARDFVLTPATRIAPRWRDPRTGLRLAHLAHRLARPATLDLAPHPA
jgi:2-amino-4-hydroxy-6-hydroxymethyldihydropteridine diphosphokinase